MGGGTRSTPNNVVAKYNSFIDIDDIVLSLDTASSPATDAAENYWSSIDTTFIGQKIYGRNDDIRIENYINYLLILTKPHPNTPNE
jgi:hypothetical protein